MGDTTGNQNLAIATNGTSHVAMTSGPTDVCKLPDNKPVPFPNFIASQGNLQNGTTNTNIANEPVWIQRSNLGPTSDPAHAGVNKGVSSGTYRGIAKATGFSKDVQMEGQFVVRTGDPTTQNNANTTGSVMGSNMMAQVEADDAYKKLLCTITKLEGVCGHGRELGPPPGSPKDVESNYLEILLGDTVTFTSTRENLVTRAIDPGCEKGIHTHWEAKTTGQSWAEAAKSTVMGEPEVETKDAEKVYKLGGKLTGESSVEVGKTQSQESNVKDYARRNRMKSPKPEDDGFLGTASSNVTAANSSGNWAHDGAVTNKGNAAEQERRKDANFKRKVKGFIKDAALFWDASAHPRVITVEASACSGKKAATIKCLPKDKLEVSLFDDKIGALVEKVPGREGPEDPEPRRALDELPRLAGQDRVPEGSEARLHDRIHRADGGQGREEPALQYRQGRPLLEGAMPEGVEPLVRLQSAHRRLCQGHGAHRGRAAGRRPRRRHGDEMDRREGRLLHEARDPVRAEGHRDLDRIR